MPPVAPVVICWWRIKALVTGLLYHRSKKAANRSTCTWPRSRTASSTLKTSPAPRFAQGQMRVATPSRDAPASQVAAVPATPPPAALGQVADRIDEVMAAGSHSPREALTEALVVQVKITDPGRIVPVFRIPHATRMRARTRAKCPVFAL
jgi:hypothetical protein